MKKILSITICLIAIISIALFGYSVFKTNKVASTSLKNISLSPSFTDQNLTKITENTQQPKVEEAKLPDSVNLDVSFVSQAPFAVWDNLHNEACEEASVLSIISYLEEITYTPEEIDAKIFDLVNWQETNFGGHYDLPAEKAKTLVEKYYNNKYSVKIRYDFSIDDIKSELANNNPVIVPLSGRTIGNPYFRQPGPVYHMLVIRGYDDNTNEFITNDVGTNKEGENMRYSYNVLFDSIHDIPKWEQYKDLLDQDPDMIFSGQKAMIVINK